MIVNWVFITVMPAVCVSTEGSFGCDCPVELRLTENGINWTCVYIGLTATHTHAECRIG